VSDFFTRLATRLISPGTELLWPATPSRFEAPPELLCAMPVMAPTGPLAVRGRRTPEPAGSPRRRLSPSPRHPAVAELLSPGVAAADRRAAARPLEPAPGAAAPVAAAPVAAAPNAEAAAAGGSALAVSSREVTEPGPADRRTPASAATSDTAGADGQAPAPAERHSPAPVERPAEVPRGGERSPPVATERVETATGLVGEPASSVPARSSGVENAASTARPVVGAAGEAGVRIAAEPVGWVEREPELPVAGGRRTARRAQAHDAASGSGSEASLSAADGPAASGTPARDEVAADDPAPHAVAPDGVPVVRASAPDSESARVDVSPLDPGAAPAVVSTPAPEAAPAGDVVPVPTPHSEPDLATASRDDRAADSPDRSTPVSADQRTRPAELTRATEVPALVIAAHVAAAHVAAPSAPPPQPVDAATEGVAVSLAEKSTPGAAERGTVPSTQTASDAAPKRVTARATKTVTAGPAPTTTAASPQRATASSERAPARGVATTVVAARGPQPSAAVTDDPIHIRRSLAGAERLPPAPISAHLKASPSTEPREPATREPRSVPPADRARAGTMRPSSAQPAGRRPPARTPQEVAHRVAAPARRGGPTLEVTVEIGAIEIVSDTVVRAPTHKQAPLTLADYLKARGPR